MPPQDPEEAEWFAAELRPHEPMLRAWLRSHFRAADQIDDVIQEAYLRVLRARAQGEVRAPKAFLFVTARNLMLMHLRHCEVTRIDPLTERDFEGILDDRADVAAEVARSQELEMLTQAIQSLPTRCRQILTLRKIYGLSQKEVAAELGISEHTVEAQGTIALRKLGEFFAGRGIAPPPR
ncbi:MAG: sigma-70 family RNA polymerase sigma factor [Opitutaceae bacterium]|nr:sigma-70 family RNA polymerase sigma factor [Opitutaceae bacterium]